MTLPPAQDHLVTREIWQFRCNLLASVRMGTVVREFSIVPSASGSRSVPKRQRHVSADKADIRKAIVEMLERSGLTRAEMAARLGCSRQNIEQQFGLNSQITTAPGNGKTYQYERKPSFEWVARAAAICGVQIIFKYADVNEKEIV